MRSEKIEYLDFYKSEFGVAKHCTKSFGYAVWQHQQSKVDELQKRVDASLIAFEKLKDEINELHGQCDLHLIKYLEEKSQVLEQVIKGGSDASN